MFKKLRKSFFKCLICTFVIASHLIALPTQSYAQVTLPTIPTIPTPTFINDALSAVQAGAATPLQAATLIGGQIPGAIPAELTGAITQLQTAGNLLFGSPVVAALATGQLTPAMALQIAGLPTLGQITSLPEIQGFISSITGPLAQITSTIQMVQNLEATLATVLSPQGLQNLAIAAVQNAIATQLQAIPQLAALGNIAQLAGALGNLANFLQNATPAQIVNALLTGALGGILSGALGLGGGGPTNSLTNATTRRSCCNKVATEIPKHYYDLRTHVSEEFDNHRTWFLTTYWTDNILPALMMMANQLTTTGILQVEMIGTLLDAKHQLETQRLFQELTARAHKDYQPSEGMCTIGTAVTSLAASNRLTDLAQTTFSQRMMMRQTMNGDSISTEANSSDQDSRLAVFKTTYCAPSDNTNGLSNLCPSATAGERQNIDIDYTRNVETRLTMDADLSDGILSPDEQDVFAISANLYSHNVANRIKPELLGDGQGKVGESAAGRLMDLRAVFAKRSVAQNSFAAITSLRASGDNQSAPYTKALIRELGITDVAEIDKILGFKPSYFAQMEVLTKKIYQNPTFYTELYDKPANVDRKGAALQAIGLMQDRDLYNSLIRSEAVLSVLLETMLETEQEKIINAKGSLNTAGGS